jgi:hypothetical protein
LEGEANETGLQEKGGFVECWKDEIFFIELLDWESNLVSCCSSEDSPIWWSLKRKWIKCQQISLYCYRGWHTFFSTKEPSSVDTKLLFSDSSANVLSFDNEFCWEIDFVVVFEEILCTMCLYPNTLLQGQDWNDESPSSWQDNSQIHVLSIQSILCTRCLHLWLEFCEV